MTSWFARDPNSIDNEIAKSLPYVFLICNGDCALISSFACSSAQPFDLIIAYSMQSSLRGRSAKRRSVPLRIIVGYYCPIIVYAVVPKPMLSSGKARSTVRPTWS